MKRFIKILVLLLLIIVQIEAKKGIKKNQRMRPVIRGWLFDEAKVLPPGMNLDDLDDDDYDFFLSLFEKNNEEISSMTPDEEQEAFAGMQKQIKEYIDSKSKIKKIKNKKNKKNQEPKSKNNDDVLQKPQEPIGPETIEDLTQQLSFEPIVQASIIKDVVPVKIEDTKPLESIFIPKPENEDLQETHIPVIQEPEVAIFQDEADEDDEEDQEDLQEEFSVQDINESVRETVRTTMREVFAQMAGSLGAHYSDKPDQVERHEFFDYSQPVVHNISYQQPVEEAYPWTQVTNENPIFSLEPEKTSVEQTKQSNHKKYQKKRSQKKKVAPKKNNSPVGRAKKASAPERSLNTSTASDNGPMLINAAAFAQANRFYLAPALNADSKTDAVDGRSFSVAQIKPNTDNTGKEIFIQSLVPSGSTVQVNGADVDTHPLKGKSVAAVTLVGKDLLPAVVLAGDPTPDGDAATKLRITKNDNGAAVYLMTQTDGLQFHSNVGNENVVNPETPAEMLVNDVLIKDANNQPINQQIVALAASKPLSLNNAYVFAAVPDGSFSAAIPGSLGINQEKAIKKFLQEAGQGVFQAIASQNNASTAAGKITQANPILKLIAQVLIANQAGLIDDFVKKVVAEAKRTGGTEISGLAAKTGSLSASFFSFFGTNPFTAKKEDVKAVDIAAGITEEAIKKYASADTLEAGLTANNIDSNLTSASQGTIAVINAMLGWAIHGMLAVPAIIPANSVKTWKSAEIADADGVVSRYGDGKTSIAGAEGKYRGIAVLKNNQDSLTVWKNEKPDFTAVGGAGTDRYASYLKTDVEDDLIDRKDNPVRSIAFSAPCDANPISNAVLGSGVDMFWDEPLQRLYIGLSDVTRGAPTGAVWNKSGGVCNVLMGKWDNNVDSSVFKLYPVIKNVNSYLFQDDITPDAAPAKHDVGHFRDYIFGFYLNDKNTIPSPSVPLKTVVKGKDDNPIASAKKVRVMHTSTGLDYLIINGGVATEATKDSVNAQVFAVPLVGINGDKGFVAQNILNGQMRFETSVDLNQLLQTVGANVKVGVQAIVDKSVAVNNAKTAAEKILKEKNEITIQAIASLIVANMIAADGKKALEQIFPVLNDTKATSAVLTKAITAEGNGKAVATVQAKFQLELTLQGFLAKPTSDTMATEVLKVASNDAETGIARAIEGGLLWGIKKFYESGRAEMLKQIKNMPRATDKAAIVGADSKIISADGTGVIQDIQILGDIVFISMGGARDDSHADDNGIFASTALFDNNGKIIEWTPWERMLGRVEAVGGFGIDTDSSNIWFITTKDGKFDIKMTPTAQFNQVKVTNWGIGDVALHTPSTDSASSGSTSSGSTSSNSSANSSLRAPDVAGTASGTLQSVLDPLFVNVPGGILHLQNFGPDVNGFKQGDKYKRFSMMVATGTSQIALIQMGNYDSDSNTFLPTKKFSADNNVFMIDKNSATGKVLDVLGEITCVELSRLPLSNDPGMINRGWLFAGGVGGVAVLSRADGRGWDTSLNGGLDDLKDASNAENFPLGSRWQFLQLKFKDSTKGIVNPFRFVRKIMSDQDKYLYIMTATEVWRVEMNQTNFKRGSAATRNEVYLTSASAVKIAQVNTGKLQASLSEGEEFYDMMVINRDKSSTTGANPAPNYTSKLLLATSQGLYVSGDIRDDYDGQPTNLNLISWTAVSANGVSSLGPVLLLEFASAQPGDKMFKYEPKGLGKYAPDGNLYATAFDKDQTFLAVYRFVLSNGAIAPVVEKFIDASGAPQNAYFYKIGTLSDVDKMHADEEFLGARDFALRTKLVAGSKMGFGDDVPMLLTTQDFVRDSFGQLNVLDLQRDVTLPLYLGTIVRDSASGAPYIAGEFGIRVNE